MFVSWYITGKTMIMAFEVTNGLVYYVILDKFDVFSYNRRFRYLEDSVLRV